MEFLKQYAEDLDIPIYDDLSNTKCVCIYLSCVKSFFL